MNIVISGSGKGLGFETTKIFAGQGTHKIVAISRDNSRLRKLLENTDHRCIDFDLEKFGSYNTLIKEITDYLPKVDILINNAGYLSLQDFALTKAEEFDKQFRINTKVPYFLIQSLLPHFSSSAHVVNIGSMGGFQGSSKFNGLSAYSISKGALGILSECLAEELKDHGIKVNCLALGAAQTEMLSKAFPGYEAPLKGSEMAEYIAWFAANGHQFFNGKILPVALSTP